MVSFWTAEAPCNWAVYAGAASLAGYRGRKTESAIFPRPNVSDPYQWNVCRKHWIIILLVVATHLLFRPDMTLDLREEGIWHQQGDGPCLLYVHFDIDLCWGHIICEALWQMGDSVAGNIMSRSNWRKHHQVVILSIYRFWTVLR